VPEPVAHTRLTLNRHTLKLQIRNISVHRALGDFKALCQVCGCALALPANELNNLKESVGRGVSDWQSRECFSAVVPITLAQTAPKTAANQSWFRRRKPAHFGPV